MNKILTLMIVFIVAISASLPSFSASYCRSIAKACMKAGYYQGGNSVGKGLVVNCMLPVTAKKMSLPNTYFSNKTLSRCRAEIMQKMQNR